MKRYHLELERTKRIHHLHLRGLYKWPAAPVNCICEFQVGRFRKQKARGCRKSRCLLCHFEKIFGVTSVKDRIRELRYCDFLDDYFTECLTRTLTIREQQIELAAYLPIPFINPSARYTTSSVA